MGTSPWPLIMFHPQRAVDALELAQELHAVHSGHFRMSVTTMARDISAADPLERLFGLGIGFVCVGFPTGSAIAISTGAFPGLHLRRRLHCLSHMVISRLFGGLQILATPGYSTSKTPRPRRVARGQPPAESLTIPRNASPQTDPVPRQPGLFMKAPNMSPVVVDPGAVYVAHRQAPGVLALGPDHADAGSVTGLVVFQRFCAQGDDTCSSRIRSPRIIAGRSAVVRFDATGPSPVAAPIHRQGGIHLIPASKGLERPPDPCGASFQLLGDPPPSRSINPSIRFELASASSGAPCSDSADAPPH